MPMKIVTAEEMARLEQKAVATGVTTAMMMEKAGQAVARACLKLEPMPKKALVLVGPGNNGGDGLVAAYHLAEAGVDVCIYIWKRKGQDDPNLHRASGRKIPILWAEKDENLGKLRQLLPKADIVIDALLGTGLSRPIKGLLKEILTQVKAEKERRLSLRAEASLRSLKPEMRSSPSPFIVAVDVPSGLNGSTGEVDPATVPADLTVTFGFPKVGHFLFPGAEFVGELLVADIGIKPELAQDIPLELVTEDLVREWLPPRPRGAHKGTFGKALVVAGSVNYIGAAYLAGAAATRVGTGLVTMALPSNIHPIVAAKLSEATYLLLPQDMGVLVPEALEILSESWPSYDALLIGPGLGRDKQTVRFVHQLLKGYKEKERVGFIDNPVREELLPLPPMVIDADGLNALAELPQWWRELKSLNVLTPHPGEMARLMKCDIEEVKKRRLEVAREKAQEWGQVVVLKGAFTCIASPEGHVYINPFANPALATAGSGDVLAGAVVGFMAQGLDPLKAAVVGAYIHGLAGELVRARLGTAGAVAGDLLGELPHAINIVRGESSSAQPFKIPPV